MSLKNINTAPVYELTVPSTGKKVKYRPYNVGEQRNLLLAQLEEDKRAAIVAVGQIIENCTFGKVDVTNSPAFDIEYILTKLRAKSAGEMVDVGVKCKDCEEVFPIQINLEKVVVEGIADKNVKLGDDLYVVMKFPTIDAAAEFDPDDVEGIFVPIARCVETIVSGEEVYDAREQSLEEVVEFIERLTEQQMESIKNFFSSIPVVSYTAKHNCPKCGHENHIYMSGVSDFFI